LEKKKNGNHFGKIFFWRASSKARSFEQKKIALIVFFTFMCFICVRICVIFVYVFGCVCFMSMSLCFKPAAKQKWEFLRGWGKDG